MCVDEASGHLYITRQVKRFIDHGGNVINLHPGSREIVKMRNEQKCTHNYSGRGDCPELFARTAPKHGIEASYNKSFGQETFGYTYNINGINGFSVFCLTSGLCWTRKRRENVSGKKVLYKSG
jgi:hypothetical protein